MVLSPDGSVIATLLPGEKLACTGRCDCHCSSASMYYGVSDSAAVWMEHSVLSDIYMCQNFYSSIGFPMAYCVWKEDIFAPVPPPQDDPGQIDRQVLHMSKPPRLMMIFFTITWTRNRSRSWEEIKDVGSRNCSAP